jgi:hypothetical protein
LVDDPATARTIFVFLWEIPPPSPPPKPRPRIGWAVALAGMAFLLYKTNDMLNNQLLIIFEFCTGMTVLAGLLLLLGRLRQG